MMLFGLIGCASWLGFDSGDEPRDPGFYQRATQKGNAIPLPVQIAQDIEKITEEGAIVMRDPGLLGVSEEAAGSLTKSGRRANDFSYNNINSNAEDRRTPEDESGEEYVEIDESQLVVQEEKGPLVQANARKRNGPLNYKGKRRRSVSSTLPPLKGGKTINYMVKLGDTLMKIAFEKYGNYLRWKDIFRVNKKKIGHPRKMKVGTELTINNVKYVYIRREGKPYLIRKSDTLKSISKKLYGTSDRWKDIWKNNPQLIRNPKKIYHGFTLYYQDKKASPAKPQVRKPSNSQSEKKTK